VSATCSFSSNGSVCSSRSHNRPQRRCSAAMSVASTSSSSSGSGHSRKAPRRTKSSSTRIERRPSLSFLELQMANVSV
jgi:hypothetical protein